jgi:hypothetical protein
MQDGTQDRLRVGKRLKPSDSGGSSHGDDSDDPWPVLMSDSFGLGRESSRSRSPARLERLVEGRASHGVLKVEKHGLIEVSPNNGSMRAGNGGFICDSCSVLRRRRQTGRAVYSSVKGIADG